MAESKSAEYANKINGLSESSSSVHPLTVLANFPRSECRSQPGGAGTRGNSGNKRELGGGRTGEASTGFPVAVTTNRVSERLRSAPAPNRPDRWWSQVAGRCESCVHGYPWREPLL